MLIIGFETNNQYLSDLDLPREDRQAMLKASLDSLRLVEPSQDYYQTLADKGIVQKIPFEYPVHSVSEEVESAKQSVGKAILYFEKIDTTQLELLSADVEMSAEEYKAKFIQPRRTLYFKMVLDRYHGFFNSHMGGLYEQANAKSIFPPGHPQRDFLANLVDRFGTAEGLAEIQAIIES